MSKNNLVSVVLFELEIGKLGFDENKNSSFFQYNPNFLTLEKYKNIFPLIIKRVSPTQVFNSYNNETFRGLPPMIADSLPDSFGNIIFKNWLESNQKEFEKISVLERLTYVSNRGIGALEFEPNIQLSKNITINLNEIIVVLKKVMDKKNITIEGDFNEVALLNIIKDGTSAGGARPKIAISENKKTLEIVPGDIEISENFNHYLVKLCLDDEMGYNREVVEFSYYQTALFLGIKMMPSKLIDKKHFATERFDRQNGKKLHVLTATGMTGWDFKKPENSSYENLFELALFLKLPLNEINELFTRMVFNVVFANTDDHLKNHSFIYNPEKDCWNLSPAYDLTYAINPLLNYTRVTRALSINGKRIEISLEDVLSIAKKFTIKNPKGIIKKVQNAIENWEQNAIDLKISSIVIQKIKDDFKLFEL